MNVDKNWTLKNKLVERFHLRLPSLLIEYVDNKRAHYLVMVYFSNSIDPRALLSVSKNVIWCDLNNQKDSNMYSFDLRGAHSTGSKLYNIDKKLENQS